jgi:hypothetical protein
MLFDSTRASDWGLMPETADPSGWALPNARPIPVGLVPGAAVACLDASSLHEAHYPIDRAGGIDPQIPPNLRFADAKLSCKPDRLAFEFIR